jgi:hypothetical protein
MADINLGVGGANSAVAGGYEIENSLKFEADNSEYLSRTYSSTTNRRTWTVSAWVKRAELGSNQVIISGGDYLDVTGVTIMQFLANDTLNLYTHSNQLTTTRVFRDTSAWYHIVWAVDSTQSTAADRVNVYINGEQITDLTGSYPVLNWDSAFNYSAYESNIGRYSYERDRHFNGYMTDINFVDGSQLASTDFGEFDEDSGIWKPKAYTGSYGTNGFYLDFESSGSLGADGSGNGNNFTLNNIAAADQATDTPTNNFCTWSSNWVYPTNRTISEGGTKLTGSSAWGGCKGSIGLTKGKWYWENKGSGIRIYIGWQTENCVPVSGNNAHNVLSTITYTAEQNYILIRDDTSIRNDTNCSGSYASGEVLGLALDLDSSPQTATFYRNGTAMASNVNIDGLTGQTVFPFISQYNNDTESNFGSYTTISIASGNTDENGYGTFEYAPPSGYYALCTKNLAEYG